MLKKYELNVNDKRVFFFHNSKEDIVNLFSEILKTQENKYQIIEDNKSVQIGWSYYVFKNVNDSYQIYTADYIKNPFKDITEDLTLSLYIMKEQLLITKKTGLISDETITFQDTLIAKKTALASDDLYFEKQQSKEENDSGWYMGSLHDTEQSDDPDDYVSILLYTLLSVCLKAVSIVNLPVGTMVIIKNGEIIGICDSDNNKVYAES